MAVKLGQQRRQEFSLSPSGESCNRRLRAISPCSDSAALSHLLSSKSWVMTGSVVTHSESVLMLWVPLRAGLQVQHLYLCPMHRYTITDRVFQESSFISTPCTSVPRNLFLTLVFDPQEKKKKKLLSYYYIQTLLHVTQVCNTFLNSFPYSRRGTTA